jgi:hypothetical protein
LNKELLALTVLMARSVPAPLLYGKRFMGKRLGIADLFERQPAPMPTKFGLAEADRLHLDLDLLGSTTTLKAAAAF